MASQFENKFTHFSLLAEGKVIKELEDFDCPVGPAVIGMKCWATSVEDACSMMQSLGGHVGYKLAGDIEVYKTEPEDPVKDKPYCYSLQFRPIEVD